MRIDLQKYWGETEIFYQAELASKIIQSMQKNGEVTLVSKEARSATQSGLYRFLDELCSQWAWDTNNISIMTSNFQESSSRYQIKILTHAHWASELSSVPKVYQAWDGSKIYGMFLGRATAERIRGVVRHQNFEFKDQGLTSFHHNIAHQIDTPELVEYLCESDSRYSEILKIRPYSDIGEVMTPPITGHFLYSGWEDVYKKIALELVFETSTADDNITFSEKLMRPMLYRRPFMLVAGKHSVKLLSDIEWMRNVIKKEGVETQRPDIVELGNQLPNFKFFENVFGTEYDTDIGIHRVDHIFDILHTLIRTDKIKDLHNKCREDVEHNYQSILKILPLLKKIANNNEHLWDKKSWPK